MSSNRTERQYARELPYDLDLSNTGAGWVGTWESVLRYTITDILDNDPSPYGPVEISIERRGRLVKITGTLIGLVPDQGVMLLRPDTYASAEAARPYDLHNIRRFRA